MDSLSNTQTKLFMRDLWNENWTWDEELPEKEEWSNNAAALANATTFIRPRQIPITEKNRLDIFVDSSLSAYAAADYLNEEFHMT